MDKKVLIFFSLFAIVMIGGPLALSLWIFPRVTANPRYMGFGLSGMIEPPPGAVFTREAIFFIVAQMVVTVVVVWLVGRQLARRLSLDRPVTIQGYLYKISRLTSKSEYDVFCKASEDWPVTDAQVDQDFKRYMSEQSIPYYVNDFIRKNKCHIDKLHLPLFMFQQH